jgi:putative transposase
VRRRAIARELLAAYRVSARRACGLVGCHRATFYYRAKPQDPAPLRMRLRELAAVRPRFGYRRLYILLRREGWRVNHKRIYRLYGEEQLAVRTKRRKKRASHLRVVLPRPTRSNEQWCMDFMADRLEDGRRIRILTVEDVFTRECLAVEIDTSLPSARVVRVLERPARERAAPAVITVDNGSEFYAPTAGRTARAFGLSSRGPESPWTIRSSRASMAACATSISTSSCSSRWMTRSRNFWSGNETTMRPDRTARWGTFPLGSSRPSGS